MANEPKDLLVPKARIPVPDDSAGKTLDPNEAKKSGRVTFDSRGNSVWEWQLETGVYSRDINTQKLKKLDLGDLSIAETASHKRPAGMEEEEQPRGGGFNPYDNASARPRSAGGNPYDNARALGKKMTPTLAAAPRPRTPDEMRKLSEWIKLKKRVEGDKDK